MAEKDRQAIWAPYDGPGGWLRGLAISLAVALFLAYAGAFGTGEAPAVRRYTYWIMLLTIGALWGPLVSRSFFSKRGERSRLWLRVGLLSLVMAVSLTGVVTLANQLVLGVALPLSAIPTVFVAVLLVSALLSTLNVLIEIPRGETAAGPEPAKFLERLPLKLRGAEVWAVESEDHYLRLHTSKGQDLILMRLADAVAELQGIEGDQVHRSWWVARDAIVGARRGDGRATLTLKDGSEVPVSRTHAGKLRERGWI
ncbi:MAG TPA: LytTR family DNA-binding domain-containing protein [Phenylobacterium sp.]